MNEIWLSIVAQLPVVGVFAYFMLMQQQRFYEHLARQENLWREFIKAEREALVAALESVTQEMREVREEVRRHDQRISSLLERRNE